MQSLLKWTKLAFYIDALTNSMNYKLVVAGNQSNGNAVTKACDDAESKSSQDDGFQPLSDDGKKVDEDPRQESKCKDQEKEDNVNSTNNVNAAGINGVNVVGANTNNELSFDPEMPALEDISTFNFSSDHEDYDEMVDMNILDTTFQCKKVKKALYGLHQAPRAWYETFLTYLLDNRFHRGKIDKTLFIKRHKDDILLVQVYVDDIIFGLTKKELCNAFEKMMHEKFQMSFMGELTFFLGLQVKQKQDGIFISQEKYVAEILKKYGFLEVKNASTPMKNQKPLLKDEDGEEVDVHMYRSMIGSLMYLTSSRFDIMFAVCACARYQVNLKVSYLHAMKKIFRYLKGQPKFGLWYPKDSSFDLVEYTNSDYARASLDRKSPTGGVNTPKSGKDSLKLNELMELCTKLQQRVLDLETTKTTQALEINSLKRSVKKLERRKRGDGDEVIVESVDVAEQDKKVVDDITLAKALIEIKSAKPKANKKRIKFFAAKRAEEKRNKPPTRAQQRNIICTYLKNMEGWKLKSLKNKSFANTQEMFDKAMKKVNTYIDYKTDLVVKMEDDKESAELKQYLEIILDDGDDVTVDATPLSSKSLTIIDYKIHKERKKSYF
nr:uncharacterized mitochondrial protein AtMg00810-like [Tanacetum cinerariifolium]